MSVLNEISKYVIPDLGHIILDYYVINKNCKPEFDNLKQIESAVLDRIPDYYDWEEPFCGNEYFEMPYPYCACDIHNSFSDLRINTPKCFYLHMKCLNDLINEGDSCQMFYLKKKKKQKWSG